MTSLTCPRCKKTTYNRTDIAQGYCGHCHDWTQPDDEPLIYVTRVSVEPSSTPGFVIHTLWSGNYVVRRILMPAP